MYTNKTHFNAMTRHRDIILCRQPHFLWAVSDFTVSDIFKRLKLKSFTIHCLAILKRVSKIHFNVYKHIFRMSLVVQQHFLQFWNFRVCCERCRWYCLLQVAVILPKLERGTGRQSNSTPTVIFHRNLENSNGFELAN